MARSHGRILATIWEDEHFLALTEQQQRLYLFLISQPNLNHAGLLPITLRRWARKAAGLTAGELEKRLHELADARFVVLDDDTEELLIRSFVRNDGVWKQPKVMGAMVSGAMEIESRLLRRALLEEMDRVPLEELSDDPTKYRGQDGPSIRAQVAEHITTLRKAFGNPKPPPFGGGYGTPSEPPSATPSGSPSDTPEEGGRKGSTHAGAGARDAGARTARVSPTPTPTPTPAPEERAGADEAEPERPQPAKQQRPDGRPPLAELPDDFELTDGMRRWAQQTYPRVDVDSETAKFVLHHQGEGTRRHNWYATWQKWITSANQYLNKHGTHSNVVALHAATQHRDGTDARVAGWGALAAQLDSQGDPS